MKIATINSFLLTVIMSLGFSIRAFAAVTNRIDSHERYSLSLVDSPIVNTAPHLRLQFFKDVINADDTYIGLDASFSPQYVVDEDATYFQGIGELNLCSFSSDNVPCAINKLPLPKQQATTIHLKVIAKSSGPYQLNMTEMVAIPQLFDIYLVDAYKNDSLDMRNNKSYAFDLNADTNSYGSKRFSLVIRQNPALMIHLLSFNAAKATDGTQITWTAENEEDYSKFAVEKSTDDGTTFSVLGGLTSSALGAYSFLDKAPVPTGTETDTYRLRITDLNGTVSYSNVVTLMYGNASDNTVKNTISIYPNPTKSIVNLTISQAYYTNSILTQVNTIATNSSAATATYNIKIVNTAGLVMKTATVNEQGMNFDVSGLLPGTYIVQILNNTDKSFVGVSKFVKQ